MIRYMPMLESMLWSRKTQRCFDNIEDLKLFIADQKTRLSRFVGRPERFYNPCDIVLIRMFDVDPIMRWRNYCSVIVDGKVVGHCGE